MFSGTLASSFMCHFFPLSLSSLGTGTASCRFTWQRAPQTSEAASVDTGALQIATWPPALLGRGELVHCRLQGPLISLNFLHSIFFFWLRWVSVAAHGLSLVAASEGLLFIVMCGLLTAVASLVAEHRL